MPGAEHSFIFNTASRNTSPNHVVVGENGSGDFDSSGGAMGGSASTDVQLALLAEWRQVALDYSRLHMQSSRHFRKCNMLLTVPIVVLTTALGASNLVGGACGPSVLSYTFGFIGLACAGLTALLNNLKYSERAGLHKHSADGFDRLGREITVGTTLANSTGRVYASLAEMIKTCAERFSVLVDQSPSVPRAMFRWLASQEELEQWQQSHKHRVARAPPSPSEHPMRLYDSPQAAAVPRGPGRHSMTMMLAGANGADLNSGAIDVIRSQMSRLAVRMLSTTYGPPTPKHPQPPSPSVVLPELRSPHTSTHANSSGSQSLTHVDAPMSAPSSKSMLTTRCSEPCPMV